MKILIIDDSKIIRDRMVSRLRETNEVPLILEAASAREAYEKIERERPEKIILDIHLPDECGIAVLKWIRNHKIQTQVIVLTSYPYPEYERKCKELGADNFLDKNSGFEKAVEILQIT